MGLGDTFCDVTVEDCGFVTWDYCPRGRNGDESAKTVARVLRLLGASGSGTTDVQHGRPQSASEGRELVGRGFEAAGLAVSLAVHGDDASFQVLAELVVENPAQPGRGRVTVGDDGGLLWECGFEEHSTSPGVIAQEHPGRHADEPDCPHIGVEPQ